MRFQDLNQYEFFGFDTETTGLNYPVDQVFGFSICTPQLKTEYYDIRREPQAIQWFNDQMRQYKGQVWAHNMPFDYSMSHATGLSLKLVMDRGNLWDTAMLALLLDEHLFSYRLDDLGALYVNMTKEEIWGELAAIFGGLATKNVQIKNLPRAPEGLVAKYCNRDALLVLKLREYLIKEANSQANGDLVEGSGIWDIIKKEQGWMPMFIKKKMDGIKVDVEYAIKAADMMTPLIDEAKKKLNKLAGWEFNPNSTPQIKKLFEPKLVADNKTLTRRIWQASDGTVIGTTKSGAPSFKSDFLKNMTHPAAQQIQEVRSLIKTRDTFLLSHIVDHSHNGRVYPNINQNKGEDGGTGTGRLSYTDPALQQIPNRNKKVAKIVKAAFLPEDGDYWLDPDMASFEVRVFAHLTNVEAVIAEYQRNPSMDLHQYVGDISGLPRSATYSGEPNAKQLNLGMIFNQGKGATAAAMGMPWGWESFVNSDGDTITYQKAGRQAEKIIAAYHKRFPGVQDLADYCKRMAETRGFIFTRMGRRIRFPNGYKSYKASGLLIQSTSADLNKENWEIITNVLDDSGSLLLNTHDSYGLSLRKGTWKEDFMKVKKEIEKPRLRVPLILDDSKAGNNWWEAIA